MFLSYSFICLISQISHHFSMVNVIKMVIDLRSLTKDARIWVMHLVIVHVHLLWKRDQMLQLWVRTNCTIAIFLLQFFFFTHKIEFGVLYFSCAQHIFRILNTCNSNMHIIIIIIINFSIHLNLQISVYLFTVCTHFYLYNISEYVNVCLSLKEDTILHGNMSK